MLQGLLDNFIPLLQKELEYYSAISAVADKKQTALIEGKLAEIEALTKTEQILLLQVGKVEEARQSLHEQLASHFSLSPEDLTISKLAELTNRDYGTKILKLQEDFTAILNKVKKTNETNGNLIKQSLDYINFSLNIITGAEASPTYPNKGEKATNTAKLFDKKI